MGYSIVASDPVVDFLSCSWIALRVCFGLLYFLNGYSFSPQAVIAAVPPVLSHDYYDYLLIGVCSCYGSFDYLALPDASRAGSHGFLIDLCQRLDRFLDFG